MDLFGFLIFLTNGANGVGIVIGGIPYEQLEDVTSQLDANCAAGEIHKILYRCFSFLYFLLIIIFSLFLTFYLILAGFSFFLVDII